MTKISNAAIWNNVLFCSAVDRYVPIYENYRWCERTLEHIKFARDRFESAKRNKVDCSKRGYLFVGSAGSFNYGHWLIDDFPRYSALSSICGMGIIPGLVLSGFDPAINQVRADAVAYASQTGTKCEVLFIDPQQVYEFDHVYFVTPVSYHPVLKSRRAIEFIEGVGSLSLVGHARSISSPKIFVNRSVKWPRRIVNELEIRAVLARHGFKEIFPEFMTFEEQKIVFSSAEHIVGIMGAAMANTAFSAPNTTVIYLAPDGWMEPFFWDLAVQKKQTYQIIFGPAVDDGHELFQRSFSVDPALLNQCLSEIL